MEEENWQEATEHLERVVNDEPKNAQAPPRLAQCYLSMGNMEKVSNAQHFCAV